VRGPYVGAEAIEMRRGKASASRAKTVTDLPQVVRVQFDRGRVTVGLSIDTNAVWGTQSTLGGTSRSAKNVQVHTELLTAIAVALEQVVAHGQAPDSATGEWDRIEAQVAARARRRARNLWITLAVIIGLFAGMITIAIVAD
jgi:hypothetical protein